MKNIIILKDLSRLSPFSSALIPWTIKTSICLTVALKNHSTPRRASNIKRRRLRATRRQISMATHLDDEDDTIETLEYLLQVSKSMAGRGRLNAEGILPAVLRRLSSSPEPLLLPRLLLVRNLCYGDRANHEVFLAAGGLDRVASALISQPSVGLEAVRTVLQILANCAAGDEEHKEAVWARFFPLWVHEMSWSRDAAIHNTLCRVLYACCTAGEWRRRLSELLDIERGLPILLNIIATMLRGEFLRLILLQSL